MWTVDEIRENYRKFEDWKIKEIASDPGGLRKEIIPILNEEIKRRNLDMSLIDWVNHETKKFEGLERKNLIERITKSSCGLCGINSDLRGYRFNTVISALTIITDKTEHLIICSDCARSKRIKSMLQTFFFGWWSKSGMLSTPFALISDSIKIFRKNAENEEVLNAFIDNNTGMIRLSLEANNLGEVLTAFNQHEHD